jgi:hypothetical protein
MTIDWQMKRKKLDELLSVDKLTDWLRAQPPQQEYIWSDPVNCLMGKYLSDHDLQWGDAGYHELPGYIDIAAEKPWTYGAALERAQDVQKVLAPPPLQIEATPIEVRELDHEPGRRQGADQVQPEQLIEHRPHLGGPDQAGHSEADRPL